MNIFAKYIDDVKENHGIFSYCQIDQYTIGLTWLASITTKNFLNGHERVWQIIEKI